MLNEAFLPTISDYFQIALLDRILPRISYEKIDYEKKSNQTVFKALSNKTIKSNNFEPKFNLIRLDA